MKQNVKALEETTSKIRRCDPEVVTRTSSHNINLRYFNRFVGSSSKMKLVGTALN